MDLETLRTLHNAFYKARNAFRLSSMCGGATHGSYEALAQDLDYTLKLATLAQAEQAYTDALRLYAHDHPEGIALPASDPTADPF